jgi:soluble lytic murein transglycosylase
MAGKKTSPNHALRLTQLAAAVIICWSLGTNTHVGAMNTWYADPRAEGKTHSLEALNTAGNLQVLSPKDADLYRAVFASQAKADWKGVDSIAPEISDRRLIGYVLADRYQHHMASAQELREWFAAYAALPVAADLYEQYQQLPVAKAIKLAKPDTGGSWMGGDSYGAAPAFKIASIGKAVPSAPKVNHALHQGEPYLAEAYLDKEQKRHPVAEQKLAALKGRIAASFFFDGKNDDAQRLAKEAAASQDPLGSWIDGLSSWKKNDMREASLAFGRLAVLPQLSGRDRAAAAFWAYRATNRLGNQPQADYWLRQAAAQPHSFYGFLAGSLLGHDNLASWQLPALDAKNRNILTSHAAGWRALALLQIGKPDLAEAELRHLNPQGRHDLQDAILAVAEAGHMPSMALRIGGLAVNDNGKPYDGALYPVPPWQPIEGFHTDRALIYALMRHESHFDPMAVSGSGACGLMQLMPATARLISTASVKTAENEEDCPDRLLDPAVNMTLGQSYVQHLAAQSAIGDNLLLLLAAYNGGPNRLAHWMDNATTQAKGGKTDPLLFVESLPVRETRDYIQQVLVHYWMYRSRLGQPETSLHQLARGEWPRVKMRDEIPALPQMLKVQADGFAVASK